MCWSHVPVIKWCNNQRIFGQETPQKPKLLPVGLVVSCVPAVYGWISEWETFGILWRCLEWAILYIQLPINHLSDPPLWFWWGQSHWNFGFCCYFQPGRLSNLTATLRMATRRQISTKTDSGSSTSSCPSDQAPPSVLAGSLLSMRSSSLCVWCCSTSSWSWTTHQPAPSPTPAELDWASCHPLLPFASATGCTPTNYEVERLLTTLPLPEWFHGHNMHIYILFLWHWFYVYNDWFKVFLFLFRHTTLVVVSTLQIVGERKLNFSRVKSQSSFSSETFFFTWQSQRSHPFIHPSSYPLPVCAQGRGGLLEPVQVS